MAKHRKLVTFDWALKRLLRAKANFAVLEGFLSELLKEDITIVEILESESNKESEDNKFNRTDLIAKDARGRRILIEVQYTRQDDYFQRMIYGTTKVLGESLDSGDSYGKLARVVSVNIVHFDLGIGKDYVYEGQTEFRGLHLGDTLELLPRQQKLFDAEKVSDLFPEYYILKVTQFNDVAKDGLDEWMYFLKHGETGEKFRAKGLKEAQEAMDYLRLSDEERERFDAFVKEQRNRLSEAESTIIRLDQTQAELKAALRQKEEALRQKEAALRQKEEALRREEEAQREKEAALRREEEAQREKEAVLERERELQKRLDALLKKDS